MSPDTAFSVANNVALLSWLLLLFLGRRPWVPRLVTGIVVPALFALAYATIFLLHGSDLNGGSFNSLSGVAALFANRWLLLAGWIHYLAFDLFIGSWEARDAAVNGISHWLVILPLILTFMLGPVGLFLYLVLRFALRKQIAISPAL